MMIHKVSFLNLIVPNSFEKFLTTLHTDYFYVQGFVNVPNTAGLKQYRCSAIIENMWSHSRLPEISKFLKLGDGFVIAVNFYFVSYFAF